MRRQALWPQYVTNARRFLHELVAMHLISPPCSWTSRMRSRFPMMGVVTPLMLDSRTYCVSDPLSSALAVTATH